MFSVSHCNLQSVRFSNSIESVLKSGNCLNERFQFGSASHCFFLRKLYGFAFLTHLYNSNVSFKCFPHTYETHARHPVVCAVCIGQCLNAVCGVQSAHSRPKRFLCFSSMHCIFMIFFWFFFVWKFQKLCTTFKGSLSLSLSLPKGLMEGSWNVKSQPICKHSIAVVHGLASRLLPLS